MKLSDILEMAYPVGSHPEFTTDQISQATSYLADGKTIPVEGGKFTLVIKDVYYALKRTDSDQLVGWVVTKPPITIHGLTVVPVDNIQIIPQYRNTTAVLILINAIREVINHPVWIDGPIFHDGQQLLNALQKRNLATMTMIDKSTGTSVPFDPSLITLDDKYGIMLEHGVGLMWNSTFPGGHFSIIHELFGPHDETSDINK